MRLARLDTAETRACIAAGAAAVVTPTFTELDVDVPVVRFAEAAVRAEAPRPAATICPPATLAPRGGGAHVRARTRMSASTPPDPRRAGDEAADERGGIVVEGERGPFFLGTGVALRVARALEKAGIAKAPVARM